MIISRGMSAGNSLPLVFCLVALAVLSLLPISSYATIFWDDELEASNTGYTEYPGIIQFDTAVKISGSGSMRLDYPVGCLESVGGNQCGGGRSRYFTPTDVLYTRFYIRLSAGFQVSQGAYTKLPYNHGTGHMGNVWSLGCCGSRQLALGLQNVPAVGQTTAGWTTRRLQDTTWYCVEGEERKGTPGAANGIYRAWVDGQLVAERLNVEYPDGQWTKISLFRQEGFGSIWYDRLAVGNVRIGCLGSAQTNDVSSPPTGLTVQ